MLCKLWCGELWALSFGTERDDHDHDHTQENGNNKVKWGPLPSSDFLMGLKLERERGEWREEKIAFEYKNAYFGLV